MRNRICINCKKSTIVSESLGVCVDCIREDFEGVLPHIRSMHIKARREFNLPEIPPKSANGIRCNICINECEIGKGERGFCGIRKNENGKLVGGYKEDGNLLWYYDPLPTNCVADWVCPGGTGAGFPRFAYSKGPEFGYKNLAVFYNSCTFNCLFCQNWHYREAANRSKNITTKELADCVDEKTSCVCFFGGDPVSQLLHSIESAHRILERTKGRIFRICWETNGSMNPAFLDEMAELSLTSGGCIKFDLKTWTEELNVALCGISNKRTISNFAELAKFIKKRRDPPLLVASTLLIPGYIDEKEIRAIARFIAGLDRNIPYSLLAFHPEFWMKDLPTTSRRHAQRAYEIAIEEGLRRVKIGNVHLLGEDY